LALGNYLNTGNRGGAYGFKISSILKLTDTKSSIQGRKHTLLHYLTELIEKKFPKLLGFETELAHVEEGSKGIVIMFIFSWNSTDSNVDKYHPR
jgi:hypothetical protein